jgi:hypothetical protein
MSTKYNLQTQRRVLAELKKYSYPIKFYGKNTAGTANSPFQLLHYILKEGVVHVEQDNTVHEWSWNSNTPERRVIENGTWEVVHVQWFD